jgi:hypothetical protein
MSPCFRKVAPDRSCCCNAFRKQAGKNRMHFDVEVADIDAEVERLVGPGTTRVTDQGRGPGRHRNRRLHVTRHRDMTETRR